MTKYAKAVCEICGNFCESVRIHRDKIVMPSKHSNEKVPHSIVICESCAEENEVQEERRMAKKQ